MYLELDDVKLYYERSGKAGAQPLLLIHGAVADADYFKECVKTLGLFYDVITYDRRGNSRSTYSEGASFDMQAQAFDAKALIETLDLKDLIVVGHSAGGLITLELMKTDVLSRIRHAFVYETPLLTLFQRVDPEIMDWVEEIMEINAIGTEEAHIECAREFGKSIGLYDDRAPKKTKDEKWKDRGLFAHFINHEFPIFSYYEADIPFCKAHKDMITAISGDRAYGSTYQQAMKEFAKEIGCEQLHFAGCHNLPYDLPLDFATCMIGAIERNRLSVTGKGE